MENINKDNLPESFASYEDAGKFWDTHDSTDYEEHLIFVHENEIELDQDLLNKIDPLP